jgi:DNA-binding transcriptional regulator YiaG
MSDPYVSRCGVCGEPTVKPIRLDRYETTLSHDGREYPLSVIDLDVYRCDSCGEVSLDDDGNERVTVALYDTAKLLHPWQIRSERERLKYKSKDFAELLGISPSTLSRWENGYQIQQRSMDRAMRQLFAVPSARKYAAMLTAGDAVAYEVPCRVFNWLADTSSTLYSQAQSWHVNFLPAATPELSEILKNLVGQPTQNIETPIAVKSTVPPKKFDARMVA